jgi:hypothetical protein
MKWLLCLFKGHAWTRDKAYLSGLTHVSIHKCANCDKIRVSDYDEEI